MQKGLRLKAAVSKKKPNSDDTDIATGAVKPKIHPHVGARFPRFSSQGHGPMGRRAPQAKAKNALCSQNPEEQKKPFITIQRLLSKTQLPSSAGGGGEHLRPSNGACVRRTG